MCKITQELLIRYTSLTKEGGAHERDGSFDIIACYFCGSVLHRQS